MPKPLPFISHIEFTLFVTGLWAIVIAAVWVCAHWPGWALLGVVVVVGIREIVVRRRDDPRQNT